MILFLRNQYDNTIVDIEIFRDYEVGLGEYFIECRVSIDIVNYTKAYNQLLGVNQTSFMHICARLSELRNSVWDNKKDDSQEELDRITNELRELVSNIANEYNLKYVED